MIVYVVQGYIFKHGMIRLWPIRAFKDEQIAEQYISDRVLAGRSVAPDVIPLRIDSDFEKAEVVG